MELYQKIASIILILLSGLIANECLAKNSINPFQGSWVNDYGDVNITHCQEKECKITIATLNGAHSCELEGDLIILSKNNAMFQIENYDDDKPQKKRFVPINLSLSKQVITVTIPEGSDAAARRYCGFRGFFEGEYTNSKAKRIYETSFNCDKAKTKIEFTICQSSDLAHADVVLSKLYFKLKIKLSDSIVNQQKEWLKARDTCINSLDLVKCLSDKYSNRILNFQQELLGKNQLRKNSFSYNYDYFLFLSKHSDFYLYEIFSDPPLQNYLNTALPKETFEKIIPAVFNEIELEYLDDSLLMIKGGAPGLYTICEGALVLTREHQTWLAYINIDNKHKSQLVIICPMNANIDVLPAPLKKWVKRLLPHMEKKEIIYKRILP